MASRAPDADIDHLYQLPLSDFTAARNELAKRAGAAAATVRALPKPTVPAWAVNQLHWRKRDVYDALVARAEDLRATHHAALQGKKADLRGAARAHEQAVDAALKTTLALLGESGHPATDATRQAIATTLRELPGEEPAGRLSRQLEPRGFDVFGAGAARGRVRVAPAPPARPAAPRPSKPDPKARAAARQEAAAAARAVREAEHAARRDEFEAARASRDAEKAAKEAAEAERRVTAARQALEEAESELEEATQAASRAQKAQETARTRADRSSAALAAAREREAAARKADEDS